MKRPPSPPKIQARDRTCTNIIQRDDGTHGFCGKLAPHLLGGCAPRCTRCLLDDLAFLRRPRAA